MEADHSADFVDRVRQMAGGSARIWREYGGAYIEIVDPDAFPWHMVLDALTKVRQDVWVTRRGANLVIRSMVPAV